MKKEQKYCYLVCSAKDDLPCAVLDSIFEVMQYLGVGRTTASRVVNQNRILNGFYVEKVLL